MKDLVNRDFRAAAVFHRHGIDFGCGGGKALTEVCRTARIRELTGGYAVPAHGCTTWRVALQELDAFERDLLLHVHLENNVLFPMARALAAPPAAG